LFKLTFKLTSRFVSAGLETSLVSGLGCIVSKVDYAFQFFSKLPVAVFCKLS
jgi:hypothetical protein